MYRGGFKNTLSLEGLLTGAWKYMNPELVIQTQIDFFKMNTTHLDSFQISAEVLESESIMMMAGGSRRTRFKGLAATVPLETRRW